MLYVQKEYMLYKHADRTASAPPMSSWTAMQYLLQAALAAQPSASNQLQYCSSQAAQMPCTQLTSLFAHCQQ